MQCTTFNWKSSLITSSSVFQRKEVRHPALVEQHQDVLPPGQAQQQQAGREGDGHAGRHQSRIFRCGIIWPDHIVFADNCSIHFLNLLINSFCAEPSSLSLNVDPWTLCWNRPLGLVSCPQMPVYPVDDSEDDSVDLPALASPGMVRAAVGYSGTELHNIAVHLYKDDYWTPSPRPVPHVHSSRNPIRFPTARPTEKRREERTRRSQNQPQNFFS